MQREELNRYRDGLSEVSQFRDYCPNGLQVEGRGEIRRIASGVTAGIELIQPALGDGADAIVLRHRYFWKGDDLGLTGTRRASAWSTGSSTFPIRYEPGFGPGRDHAVFSFHFNLLA